MPPDGQSQFTQSSKGYSGSASADVLHMISLKDDLFSLRSGFNEGQGSLTC